MPGRLKRCQQAGDLHFVTFSCHHRLPYLGSVSALELFERSLETVRFRYCFFVTGYVVIPEHLASMTSSHANGVSVSYTYDSQNRLSTVVDSRLAGNQTTTYGYDTANNVATVTYPKPSRRCLPTIS